MSPVKVYIGLALTAALLILSACGSPTEGTPSSSANAFDAETSYHPSDWLPAGHVGSARSSADSCRECHGRDLSGGIAKISCSSCHLGGPSSVHPAAWDGHETTLQLHGDYVSQHGTGPCSVPSCHGTALEGVAGSGPACRECHGLIVFTQPESSQ